MPRYGEASRIALIDTSGYCADCNLSALMPQHAMKPYRMLATSELIAALQLHEHCRHIVPPLVTVDELTRFHADAYVGNLGVHNTASWTWSSATSCAAFSADCPPVEGVVEHALATVSGSLMGATLLNSGKADIAMHWAGGMHHAKCGECSGFCYVNDIVISICELLRCHERVLYIDLDLHHGDGVDEAFCASDRVFVLSLHKFGDSFFPGTGHPCDVGVGGGRYYTMNLALWDGITDFFFCRLFGHALRAVVTHFAPDAVVLQCGADALAGDRLGSYNVSSAGLGRCVAAVRALQLPLLVVGGGGYTVRNVAKLWAYETSVLCGRPLPLNVCVPVAAMPLSGWLYEHAPLLLVPHDESNRPLPGTNVQRAYSAVREQIDRCAPRVQPHPRRLLASRGSLTTTTMTMTNRHAHASSSASSMSMLSARDKADDDVNNGNGDAAAVTDCVDA